MNDQSYGTRVIGQLRLNQCQEWREKWPAVADTAMDIAAAAMRELPPNLDLSTDANGDLNPATQRRFDAITRDAIGIAAASAADGLPPRVQRVERRRFVDRNRGRGRGGGAGGDLVKPRRDSGRPTQPGVDTMTEHTPGPWHRNIHPVSRYPIVFAGRNTHIARVITQGLTDSEAEANCDLIAAAPDLLRELQSFVDRWSKYPKPPTGEELNVYLDSARAAIAKATGTPEPAPTVARHVPSRPAGRS